MREIHEIYQYFILFWTGERNRVCSNLNGVQAIEVIGITEKKKQELSLEEYIQFLHCAPKQDQLYRLSYLPGISLSCS